MRDARPSATAQLMLMGRAVLTHARIIDDPCAPRLLKRRSRLLAFALTSVPVFRRRASQYFAHLATRTLYFDEALKAAVDGGVSQVVVLAAGYDSRAVRMSQLPARFFEVDHPATRDRTAQAGCGPDLRER